jgi:hypothetical protein
VPELEILWNRFQCCTFCFCFLTLLLTVETKIYKGIYAAVRLSHCTEWLPYDLDERASVPIIVNDMFYLSNLSFIAITQCLIFSRFWRSFLLEAIRQTLNLTEHFHLVPSQRMCEGIILLHSNQPRYLLYHRDEKVLPVPVSGCNNSRLSFNSDSV